VTQSSGQSFIKEDLWTYQVILSTTMQCSKRVFLKQLINCELYKFLFKGRIEAIGIKLVVFIYINELLLLAENHKNSSEVHEIYIEVQTSELD